MASGGTVRANTAAVLAMVNKQADDMMQHFAELMVEAAKDHPSNGGAPVDTGNLRDSITIIKLAKKLYWVVTRTGRKNGGEGYGGWVHIGTTKMAANPYFARAFAKAMAIFQRDYKAAGSGGIKPNI